MELVVPDVGSLARPNMATLSPNVATLQKSRKNQEIMRTLSKHTQHTTHNNTTKTVNSKRTTVAPHAQCRQQQLCRHTSIADRMDPKDGNCERHTWPSSRRLLVEIWFLTNVSRPHWRRTKTVRPPSTYRQDGQRRIQRRQHRSDRRTRHRRRYWDGVWWNRKEA